MLIGHFEPGVISPKNVMGEHKRFIADFLDVVDVIVAKFRLKKMNAVVFDFHNALAGTNQQFTIVN